MCQSSWNWRCLFPCYNECCIKAISLVYRPYNPHLLHFRVILFWNLGYLNAYQKTHYLPNLQKNVSFYMVYPILVCKRTASWSTNIRTILKTLQFLLYPVYIISLQPCLQWFTSLVFITTIRTSLTQSKWWTNRVHFVSPLCRTNCDKFELVP